MTYLDSVILGLVQGITEFLPISSSGHLVITSHLLNVGNSFTFDVLLNFGTLGALIIYYRKRIWSIIKRAFLGKEWGLLAKVIAATIPAAVLGIIFSNQIEKLNDKVWLVIAMLFIVGLIMIFKGNARPEADNTEIEKSVGWRTTFKVGLAQAIALIPGVSRSGITILTGLQSKLSAAKAAEFSFLLAIPIIAGASLKTLLSNDGMQFVKDNLGQVAIGNLVSLLSGLIAVSFLIKLLSSRGLKDFGWYRVGLATALVILAVTGII
jgi:undecaprenyl-diphosphatase